LIKINKFNDAARRAEAHRRERGGSVSGSRIPSWAKAKILIHGESHSVDPKSGARSSNLRTVLLKGGASRAWIDGSARGR
jgi:hypothetical protein